jgi:hypothetical protein
VSDEHLDPGLRRDVVGALLAAPMPAGIVLFNVIEQRPDNMGFLSGRQNAHRSLLSD